MQCNNGHKICHSCRLEVLRQEGNDNDDDEAVAVNLRNRLPVGGGCVYVLQLFFCSFFVFCFYLFFPSTKTMRQPFSGTAERIFMKLSPNDRGECTIGGNVV